MSSPFPRDFVKILGTKFSSRPSKETETIRGGTFHETKSFPFAHPVAALRPARGLRGDGLPTRVGRRRSGAFAQGSARDRALPRGIGQREQRTAARGCGQRAGRHLYARRGRAFARARSGRVAARRSLASCSTTVSLRSARWSRSPSAAIFWRAIPHCSAGWSASPSCRTNLTTAARSTCVC